MGGAGEGAELGGSGTEEGPVADGGGKGRDAAKTAENAAAEDIKESEKEPWDTDSDDESDGDDEDEDENEKPREKGQQKKKEPRKPKLAKTLLAIGRDTYGPRLKASKAEIVKLRGKLSMMGDDITDTVARMRGDLMKKGVEILRLQSKIKDLRTAAEVRRCKLDPSLKASTHFEMVNTIKQCFQFEPCVY